MTSYFHKLEEIPRHDVPVGQLQLLSGQEGSIFWIEARAGTEAPEHSHDMEQMTWLVSGRFEARIGDGPRESVNAGTIMLVPAGVPHQVWYVEDCTIVEFAAPPRFDWFPAARTHPYGLEEGATRQISEPWLGGATPADAPPSSRQ